MDAQPAAAARSRRFAGKGDVSIQMEAGPSAAALARSALIPMERRVDEELMADLRLLVSELVTNSVRHADVPPPATVSLDVSLDSRKIYVEGSRPDIRVPMREISQSDTPASFGAEKNRQFSYAAFK